MFGYDSGKDDEQFHLFKDYSLQCGPFISTQYHVFIYFDDYLDTHRDLPVAIKVPFSLLDVSATDLE